MNVLHIYASEAKFNAGDFFLGPSTKMKFEKMIEEKVSWTDFNVRNSVNDNVINYFNKFDAIVIGGGGLLLPDTNTNKISCWQFAIPESLIRKISSKIYVISIGYNLFFGQTSASNDRNTFSEDKSRVPIFKKNMETLIDHSEYFSMRHNGDIENLKSVLSSECHHKIKFEFCPVIDYVIEKHSDKGKEPVYHTFEIKDDRESKRYMMTSKSKFYKTLKDYILFLKEKGESVAVMSHDGSRNFLKYLNSCGVSVYFMDNAVANESKIIKNFNMSKVMYCSAGHSQMMSYALKIKTFSLASHDKLMFFQKDICSDMVTGKYVHDLSIEDLKGFYTDL